MLATPLCILLTLLAADPTGPAAKAPSRKGHPTAVQKSSAARAPRSKNVKRVAARKPDTAPTKSTARARKKATVAARSAAPPKHATAKHAPGKHSSGKGATGKGATGKGATGKSETGKSSSAKASAKSSSVKHAAAKHAAPSQLTRARELLRAVKQDPERRKHKHEWEKAIRALEAAAKGKDRAPALLEAARARYALYRFSSDEADRDRALSLAKKAQSAGAGDARTFIAAVRREAGDDTPEPPRATRARAGSLAKPPPAQKPGPAERKAPARDVRVPPDEDADEPPDTDPVLDRILAQLAEDTAEPSGDDPVLDRILSELSDHPRAGAVAGSAGAPPERIAVAPTAPASGTSRALPQQTAPAEKVAAAPTAPASGASPTLPQQTAPPVKVALPPLDEGAVASAKLPAVDVPPLEPSLLPPSLLQSPAVADEASGPIRKIVIDPGHGGHDSGAVGPSRVREKDVVLAISKRLARKLRAEGFEVVLTREDDRYLALAERTALANAHQGDLFVSIHANAHPRRDRQGVETWVLDVNSDRYSRRLAARENGIVEDADSPLDVRRILADLDAKVSSQASRRLASVVQREMTSGIRSRFGPVRDLGVKSALFYVLLGARMPAVLVETSFISNRTEEKRLSTRKFQEEVASSLARAIETFAAQQSRIAAR